MALFKILKGKSANLPANKVNGYCYVTTDEHKLYVDYTKDDGTLDRFALNAVSADKWKTARNLNGMVVNGTSNVVNYGTCSTAAATAAKVVSCSNFALITGAEITVKFTTTNTAANPTLNVNSTGAKDIYYRGSAISAGYLAANRTYTFRYNGSQYDLVGDINTDTNTTYGSMSIDEGTTGTATTNRVLTATNLKGIINAHAPTKKGGGASGTWGINISGNAATTTKLATARTISLTGSVTGSGSFDGSGNLNIATTTNHTHSYLPLSGGTLSGDINFSNSNGSITWNSATWHQRIKITDDATSDTAVFTFQQSSDSGSSFTDLMVIRDNGKVVANTFVGALSGNASTASKVNNKLKVGSKSYDGSAVVTIAASDLGLASAMLFLGTTTTAITDGATTNPITVGGASKTVTAGNVVLYGNKEFAWTGSAWEELGNEGSYKIVQAAVADPSASGTSNTFIATISQDANGKITASKKTVAVTNNAPTLSWGATSTIGTVAGTNLQVKMPANPNTDTKVTQTVTTSDASYPLLLAPSGQTATKTTTSYFDSGVTLNPSTNTIAANISGNAATATKASQDGSGNTITSTYLPLAGGTMTGGLVAQAGITLAGADIILGCYSNSSTANDSADIVYQYSNATEKCRIWALNEYTSYQGPQWRVFAADGTALGNGHLWASGESITGAVWNDYAECRESNCYEAGYVLSENGDDTLSKSTERLAPFAGVSSDTWGFSQGETEKAKTHIAVAGRVLVYPYQDRNNYKPGDCVCAAPGGTVDIMTREEVLEWPDRIVGTVSCVPEYEEWGGGKNADRDPVKVNGRIWIKVV